MRCPGCGARNTVSAPWCTQCLRPLDREPATPAEPPSTPSTPAAPPTPTPADLAGTTDEVDRAFRSIDGQLQWRCPSCEAWHPLEVSTCTVCGRELGAAVTGAGPRQVAERVGRARRALWVAAAVGAALMVVSVVLLVVALRSGAGA